MESLSQHFPGSGFAVVPHQRLCACHRKLAAPRLPTHGTSSAVYVTDYN